VLGQTIDILSADGGVSGKFDQVLHPSLPGGLRFEAFYKPESVYLQVVSSSMLAADFDEDGDVDGADLTVWKLAFGLSNLGDSDGDNDSDGADFLAWQRQLGSVATGTALAAGVPEPAGWWLALASALGAWRRAQRRTG